MTEEAAIVFSYSYYCCFRLPSYCISCFECFHFHRPHFGFIGDGSYKKFQVLDIFLNFKAPVSSVIFLSLLRKKLMCCDFNGGTYNVYHFLGDFGILRTHSFGGGALGG